MTIQQAFEVALQHHLAGRLEEAEAMYRQILAVAPHHTATLHHVGIAALQTGDHDRAIEWIRRALYFHPNYPGAHYDLGNALVAKGQLDEALAAYRRALEINPHDPKAATNLGATLAAKGQFEEALAAYRRALQLSPNDPDAYSNLGNALKNNGQLDEAIEVYRQAIARRPNSADFHWNRALVLLLRGRWKEGWEELEWRVQRPHLARPDLTAPPWNGEDLLGRTLLIHQEGGFGDTIHFIRYLPMIRARGTAKIIFEGEALIVPLMKIQPGIAEVVVRGQPLPAHDFHCPLPSFPRLFGTDLHHVPAGVPYLTIDPEKQSAWRRKLSAPPYQDGDRRQFLVGLNWAGSEQPSDLRSRTLSTFAPLALVPNVTFVSLQKGMEAGQSANVPPGMKFVDAAAETEEFSELAALTSCLDAVASVDTSVAHLAGALGIPTWILIPTQPDFRWMTEREDSPWYPTARLFRQQHFHSWDEPVQRMVEVLRAQTESVI